MSDEPVIERNAEAFRIAEALLSLATQGLMNDEFGTYRSIFELPLEVETVRGSQVIEVERDLHVLFLSIRHYLCTINATELARKIIAAEFADDTTIKTMHETYPLNGSTLLVEPVPVFSVFRRIDDMWRATKTSYVIPGIGDFNDAFKPTGTEVSAAFTLEESPRRTQKRANV